MKTRWLVNTWPRWGRTRKTVSAPVTDPRPLHQHQCCGWCAGGLHAEVVFVDKRYTTAADFLAQAQCGVDIVHGRPAPEADVDAMIAYRQRVQVLVMDPEGRDIDPQMLHEPPWVWGRPWVIYFRERGS